MNDEKRTKLEILKSMLIDNNLSVNNMLNLVKEMKMGPRGYMGKMPVNGKDYLTKEEVKKFKADVTPVKVRDYRDGIDGITPVKDKDYRDGIDGKTPVKGKDYFTKKDISLFKRAVTPVKGKDYKDGIDGKDADEEKIKGALESLFKEELTEQEKKILERLEVKLTQMVQRLQVYGGGYSREDILAMISGATDEFIREDLSSQCDGSNMTFTLSNNYKSASVALWSTQYPIVYRPVIDFTESAANQITLVAAEVGPPQTGQTLVVIYEK